MNQHDARTSNGNGVGGAEYRQAQQAAEYMRQPLENGG
jgi:hypothetical protein